MPIHLPLIAFWLIAGGAPQGWSAAELMAAAKPAGEAIALENDFVRVWRHALEYPTADRKVSESRPVVLYVKVKAESRPESTTLLDPPRRGRLSWRTGATPLGVRVEVLKTPPRTSAMRNPEADPPPGSTAEAEWNGGRLVLATFEPMRFGDGTGSSPTVTIILSDGVLDVARDGVRRRMGVRAGDVYWFEARTSLTVVSDHPVGMAMVQIDPARSRPPTDRPIPPRLD